MSGHPGQRFRDRTDAGRQLATVLDGRAWRRPIVFGIPRGGVAVAAEVSRVLGVELAILGVSKLKAPYQPQLTIGAVAADGVSYVDRDLAREVGASASYLRLEKARKAREARRREEDLGMGRSAIRGRTALVVDDGLVTASTAIAAVRSLKAAGAARVVVAVPVGPPKILRRLRREADEVFCIEEAADFVAVERLYGDFHRVGSSEIRQALAGRTAGSPGGAGFRPGAAVFSPAAHEESAFTPVF